MDRHSGMNRALAVLRLREQLQQNAFPRIEMALIVSATGVTGLLGSFLLLHAGVASMTLRYPVAVGLAYLFFLLLLALWLRARGVGIDLSDTGAADASELSELPDLPDLPDPAGLLATARGAPAARPPAAGGGGDFGGGGASASFEIDPSALARPRTLSAPDHGGWGFDLDEWLLPLVAVAIGCGLVIASIHIIWLAPTLFAELLFDGALTYSLYRRLRRGDDQVHWLGTAVRRTALPFALTAVALAAAGAAMTAYAPGARSIGEVFGHAVR